MKHDGNCCTPASTPNARTTSATATTVFDARHVYAAFGFRRRRGPMSETVCAERLLSDAYRSDGTRRKHCSHRLSSASPRGVVFVTCCRVRSSSTVLDEIINLRRRYEKNLKHRIVLRETLNPSMRNTFFTSRLPFLPSRIFPFHLISTKTQRSSRVASRRLFLIAESLLSVSIAP